MSFSATGLAHQDQIASLGDEVGAEVVAEQSGPQRRLQREVEVVDGLEKREMSVARGGAQTSAVAVPDLLGQQHGQEIAMRPLLGARLLGEPCPAAPRVGEVQPLEHGVDVHGGRIEGDHECTSKSSACAEPRPSARATKSAEMSCTSSAARKARSIASGPTAWSISWS